MLQILIILLFVLGYSAASAQSDYVVTIQGDTLRGKVKLSTSSGVKYTASHDAKYVQLIAENGTKSIHEVLQTIAFRINDDIYHTILYDPGYMFMKLIKPGYLSLYAYQMENQTTWDGRYLVKKDGSLLDVPNIGFKKKVPTFLADCQTVVKEIESGALGKADLLKIVEQYNACIDLKINAIPKKSPAVAAWTNLAAEVEALPAFDKKTDATEMIREIKVKLSKSETIPSYLISGVKDALKDQSSVQATLTLAIEKLN